MHKCDVCGKESEKVVAGRWIFFCSDNSECKQREIDLIEENELQPALENGFMSDYDVLENFI